MAVARCMVFPRLNATLSLPSCSITNRSLQSTARFTDRSLKGKQEKPVENDLKSDAVWAFNGGKGEEMKTRRFLLQLIFSCIPMASAVNRASAETTNQGLDLSRLFTDDTNKFSISIPPEWVVGEGESTGYRSVIAFYPEGNASSNVSVVITSLSPDFTKLESFGNVDAFAENLIGGLDRSWQRPPGVAAKLLDSKAKNAGRKHLSIVTYSPQLDGVLNKKVQDLLDQFFHYLFGGLYYIEYSLQNPGESRRHLYTALGIALNGWYNRLYTVTGQFFEEDSDKYGTTIQKSVSSFRLMT